MIYSDALFPLLPAPLWPFSLSLGSGTSWELKDAKHLLNSKKAIKLVKTTTWHGMGEEHGTGRREAWVLVLAPLLTHLSIHSLFRQQISSTAMFRHCSKSCRCNGEEERQGPSPCGTYQPEQSQTHREENIYERTGWCDREWLGGPLQFCGQEGPLWVLTFQWDVNDGKETVIQGSGGKAFQEEQPVQRS